MLTPALTLTPNGGPSTPATPPTPATLGCMELLSGYTYNEQSGWVQHQTLSQCIRPTYCLLPTALESFQMDVVAIKTLKELCNFPQ